MKFSSLVYLVHIKHSPRRLMNLCWSSCFSLSPSTLNRCKSREGWRLQPFSHISAHGNIWGWNIVRELCGISLTKQVVINSVTFGNNHQPPSLSLSLSVCLPALAAKRAPFYCRFIQKLWRWEKREDSKVAVQIKRIYDGMGLAILSLSSVCVFVCFVRSIWWWE